MDPNLLSMIWWGIPALAGFALMMLTIASAAVSIMRRSGGEAAFWMTLILFLMSHAVAWPCYCKAHGYGRLWCGAEPETAAAAKEAR